MARILGTVLTPTNSPTMCPTKQKLLHLLVLVTVTGGFSFQVSLVCEEYFKYVTTTIVSIVDALPVTNIPQVALYVTYTIGFEFADRIFHKQLLDKQTDGSHPGGDPRLRYFNVLREKKFITIKIPNQEVPSQ